MTESDPSQRTLAMIAHLLGILGILGAGIFYLIKKNDPTAGPFVRSQMKEVLNWEIVLLLAIIAVYIVAFVFILIKLPIIAMLLSLVVLLISVGNIVLCIINGLKANKGEAGTYPSPVRVLK